MESSHSSQGQIPADDTHLAMDVPSRIINVTSHPLGSQTGNLVEGWPPN